MSTHGQCPRCNSTYYVPDTRPGGAGRNECRNCGHIGPVRDFHIDIPLSIKTRDMRMTQEIISQTDDSVTYRVTLTTRRPAAPIRQYKDE